MLASLLGSINKERALTFIVSRGSGYAREMARCFSTSLRPIQQALDGLESAGVLVSRSVGTTRMYELNRAYPAMAELTALVHRAIDLYPETVREKLVMNRRRPRRKGKPL